MSTEVVPAAKPRHTITLTRGAAYLLEGLLQRPEPFTTPATTVNAAKLWGKLRKENKPEADGFKFEKTTVRSKDDSDIDVATRQVATNEAFAIWQDDSVTLDLSDKQRDTARTAITWGLKNRDKGTLPYNNQHLLSLLEGFALAEDSADD